MAKIEVITSVERRRKWSDDQKLRIIEETETSTVSAIAKRYKIPASQLFLWRKQLASHRPINSNNTRSINMNPNTQSPTENLLNQVKKLEQMLGRKTLELELIKEQFVAYSNPIPERINHSDQLVNNHSQRR